MNPLEYSKAPIRFVGEEFLLVEEALINGIKHANGARVAVRVVNEDETVIGKKVGILPNH